MKIFTEENSFGGKVNFVDVNNVVLGYDLSQSCCENADWSILPEMIKDVDKICCFSDGPELEELNKKYKEFVFDTSYYYIFTEEDLDDSSLDYGGGCVVFRLVNQRGREAFLYLYNSHNGYYSHGFKLKREEKIIQEDYI